METKKATQAKTPFGAAYSFASGIVFRIKHRIQELTMPLLKPRSPGMCCGPPSNDSRFPVWRAFVEVLILFWGCSRGTSNDREHHNKQILHQMSGFSETIQLVQKHGRRAARLQNPGAKICQAFLAVSEDPDCGGPTKRTSPFFVPSF